MAASLLPSSSGFFELAMEEAYSGRWDDISAGADAITTAKLVSPPPSFLPWLIYEYGLGELTPYVPSLYDLINEGVRWQRIRGTPAAVDKGLGWIGYSAEIEDTWYGRRWWNSFQLRFPELPRNDNPDLERIEGVARLSVPLRSQLRRGVHQYDVEAAVLDWSRLDNCMLDRESGITATPAGTIWSFGRVHQIQHALTKNECEAVGFWIEPDWEISESASPLWVSLGIPWVEAGYLWASSGAREIRERAMARRLVEKSIYLSLRDENGVLIGYRRCRAALTVRQKHDGPYVIDGQAYEPYQQSALIYVDAMTQFEDVDGIECGVVSLAVGGALSPGVKPGKLWLEPHELTGAVEIAVHPAPVRLRRTVREHVKYLLSFATPSPPEALVVIDGELNGIALDFTDGSYAMRLTTGAEITLGGAEGLALDFVDDSYAKRDKWA